MIWFGKKKEANAAPAAEPVAPLETVPAEPVPAPAPVEPIPEPAPVPEPAAAPVPPPVAEPVAAAPVPPPAAAPAAAPEPAAPAAESETPSEEEEDDGEPNAKDLYYSLMNAVYDAILVVDDSGHIMDCNVRVESVFGYTVDEVWDMALTKMVPGINAVVFAKMREGLSGNRRVIINARCHRKDGTTFPGEVGVGMMSMMGHSLVFSIRNIEKRTPQRAVVRVAKKLTPVA